MKLGPFSLSLNVKDLDQSLAFYETLGFTVIDGGHMNQGYPDTEGTRWRILEHDSVKIGLFQGMFDANLLTFNPPDVRSIQAKLKQAGVDLLQEAEGESGPAYILINDPDDNTLMFDQM